MNSARDPDTTISAWLDEGPTDLPEDTRSAIVVATRAIHQRRPTLLPRRSDLMTAPVRLTAAVAALAVVVVVSAVMLAPRPNLAVGEPAASPGTVATPGPSAPERSPLITASELPATPFPSPSASRRPVVSNGWIAYSTLPGDQQDGGGDIYLVREGDEPRLIAGRGDIGTVRNVCPVFSPDGSRLAFGEGTTDGGRAVVVLSMDLNGPTGVSLRIADLGTALAPCPRWSSDGTRVGYLYDGEVVVRRLDGSVATNAAGDPVIEDFDIYRSPPESLLSPTGDLIAELVLADVAIIVSRPDGSDARTIATGSYAIGTWSPDGRRILHMQDISGFDFALHATTVDEPFETVTIVPSAPVNHSRSWPGQGDVSWQPIIH